MTYRSSLTSMGLAVALAFGAVAIAQETAAPEKRTPAAVMSFHGAAWLERPTREKEEQPFKVLEYMKLKNGDTVADIGCGTGYYARKIAKQVAPDGKVYGVDIQPEFIEMIQEYCEKEGITNVVPILGDEDNPKLPKGEIDWIIMADVYHEFQKPQAMLDEMRQALKPDGRIALLEYRLNGETAAHIKLEHRMSVAQVLAEWNPAGFELVDLQEFLPSQHLFIFGKDPDWE